MARDENTDDITLGNDAAAWEVFSYGANRILRAQEVYRRARRPFGDSLEGFRQFVALAGDTAKAPSPLARLAFRMMLAEVDKLIVQMGQPLEA